MEYALAKKIFYTTGILISSGISLVYGLNFRNFLVQQIIFIGSLFIMKYICDKLLKYMYKR